MNSRHIFSYIKCHLIDMAIKFATSPMMVEVVFVLGEHGNKSSIDKSVQIKKYQQFIAQTLAQNAECLCILFSHSVA